MSKPAFNTDDLTESTPRKRGRPQATYRCADSTKIIGLVRQASGRWRISATGERFFEPDERLAIARFKAVMAKLRGEDRVELPLPPQAGPAEARQAMIDGGGTVLRAYIRPGKIDYVVPVGSELFYAAVREMLIDDPKALALRTGVEWVARGAGLPKPTPSPTLAELIEVYAAKPGITAEEITRCRKFWKDFTEIIGIKTIRELTHEHVENYEAQINSKELSPKSIKHRYTRIRTVIAHGMKRGKGPEDCRRALDVLAMLEIENVNALDPNPIDRAAFWKIHKTAKKAGDKTFAAMMLFALNAALYSSEVGAVRWDEIDLARREFTTRRHKTGVPRVAVLWPETVTALRGLPRNKATTFNTKVQAYNRFSSHREWTKYRDAAEVKGVTFAQIRDAAFTTACRVSLDQARVLAGHRLPGSVDHYVLRDPQMVADACAAIHAAYFT